MAVYNQLFAVILDGRTLLQPNKIDATFTRDNKNVTTILLDYAGHSVGPEMISLSVSSAVPAAGVEGDVITKLRNAGEITLGFRAGTTTYTCTGRIDEVTLGGSVGDPNATSFKFTGKTTGTV